MTVCIQHIDTNDKKYQMGMKAACVTLDISEIYGLGGSYSIGLLEVSTHCLFNFLGTDTSA